MESESNLHHKNTEQIIKGMMSFLDDPSECFKNEDFDDSNNPVCTGIKDIIGMFPAPPRHPIQSNLNASFHKRQEDQKTFLSNNRMKSNNFEKACRYKDPYMQEVNRLMFCSTMGHPPNGSPEYFQAAENYALYGKEFLDFPTDVKFPKPMDVSCFDGDVPSQLPSSFSRSNHVVGNQTGKYPNLGSNNAPQLPVLINPANYWGYPLYQPPNLVQPLMYSNPFLMTQYLNTFVRETQINTSFVQQHQFLTGGIQERLVYAQMLQQQVQTNQGQTGISSIFPGNGLVVKPKMKLQEVKQSELDSTCDGSDCKKTNLNSINLCDDTLDLDD